MKTILKKSIACLLAVIIVIGIVPVTAFGANAANSGQCGDNVYWALDKNGTLTISGKGAIWGYYYDGLDYHESPFWGNDEIVSVVIEEGVTKIGDKSFLWCSKLKNVTIANSVTTIGDSAFEYCGSLENIIIGNGVTAIGNSAFSDCYKLKSVTIPDSVTVIGENAFSHCENLLSAMIGNSVTTIGCAAFSDCEKLSDVTFGNSVTTIGSEAFSYCGNLANITLPDSVTSIGSYAFESCKKITNINIPSGVTLIGNWAFNSCTSLTNITIPDGVTVIGENAFSHCESLLSVTIGNGVTTIGRDAFSDCEELSDVTFGNSVTTIGSGAFSYCGNLANITLPDSLTTIEASAFRACEKIASINIPSGVTSIGNRVFEGTKFYNNKANWENNVLYIEKILIKAKESISGNNYTVKSGTKMIADGAFLHCDELESVTIPDSVTLIGKGAFEECEILKSVKLSNSITSISDYMFRYSEKLESVTIPESVTSIADEAFSGCIRLESITIPNSVTSIGSKAFSDCRNFKSITIPDSVTSIGENAFSYCAKLSSITIGSKVTDIGNYAFSHCNELKNITLPTNVTYISKGMFSTCKKLTSITIPVSVTSIGCWAFENCDNFKYINYFGTKEQWDKIEIHSYNYSLNRASVNYDYGNHKHSYTSKVTKKASTSANGTITYTCSCGNSYEETIAKVSSISLSTTSYTYDGSTKKPTVTVKDSSGKKLTSGTDYTVTYASGRKNVGSYTVKVTLKGNYSGSKTLTFKILPKQVTSLKASTQTTTSVSLSWKKVTGATGYQVYKYDSSKKAYVKVKATTGTSYKVTGLKAGTTYKFKVRAYTKTGSSSVYGAYSSVLSASTKPAKVSSLKAKTQTTTSVTLSWKKVTGATGYQVYKYDSSKKAYVKVATTTKSTYKVSKLKAGTTYKYKVRAYKKVNGSNVYGSYSSVLSTSTKLSAPTLTVTAGSKKATLSWKKITGAAGYQIYMATSKNGTYKKIATVKSGSTVKYTKTGLTAGKTYYFKIRAYRTVSGKYFYSSYSTVKSVKVK